MQLSASDLRIERGGRTVICNLSFTVRSGKCLALTGPNGAGKSTLLRALAGLLPLAGGTISLEPESDEPLAAQAHYVGHADATKNVLTLAENLDFVGALLNISQGGMVADDALARLGLGRLKRLPAAYLSAGQRRRLALARLLAAHRPIWLLDEPLTALDASSQMTARKIMATHMEEGGIIIAATHTPLELASAELRLGENG
ncbi:MAG TPA: heme ABC exporter ATP-binding protein CcmA [Methylocella sp.]|nr:heme ABC exporter ATP-binding protein CcmA [Methylocella sp.]